MRKITYIITLLCIIAINSYAQQAPKDSIYNLSLQDCINYAYEHQDSVMNAKLDVQSADYKVKETIGSGLPQVSGSVNFQDYLKAPTILFPNGKGGFQSFSIYQKYNNTFGLGLNQLLFDGTYLVGVKAAKTYKELSARSYTRSRIEVNVNVTKAYYQVLVNAEQIRLLDANVKELKQQLDETIAQNKQGFVEKIDVQRLTVQYNSIVNTHDNTLRLLGLSYQLLKFQMGMPIEYQLTLTDRLEDINLNPNIQDISADTSFYHNRVEYGLSETNLKLNQYDLQRKKAQYLPSLSFNAQTSALFQNDSFNKLYATNFPSTYIGITLNIPIFSGGQRLNQVRETNIAVLKAQNDLNNLKNALDLQASQARINYTNGLQTLKSQKENQELAAEVLRVSKIKYSQGVGSSIEVTQAETALEDADNKYIQGLYDALISKVDLEQAYGRIK